MGRKTQNGGIYQVVDASPSLFLNGDHIAALGTLLVGDQYLAVSNVEIISAHNAPRNSAKNMVPYGADLINPPKPQNE